VGTRPLQPLSLVTRVLDTQGRSYVCIERVVAASV